MSNVQAHLFGKAEFLTDGARSAPFSPDVGAATQGLPSKQKLRLRLYAAQMVLDTAGLTLGIMISSAIRTSGPLSAQSLNVLALLWPFYIAIAVNAGAYSLKALRRPGVGIRAAARALIVAAAILIGVLFYTKASEEFSRQVIAVGIVIAGALIAGMRLWMGETAGRAYNWRFTNTVLLVHGVPITPCEDEIVIVADENQVHPAHNDPLLFLRLGALLCNSDRVILACAPERRASWMAMLKGAGVDVEVLAPELDQLGALGLRRRQDRSTLLVGAKPLGIWDSAMKRGLDLAVSVPALLLCLPLMLVVAALIRLDSPGPVLFCQPRIGRGNKMFQIYKFRTMRAESGDMHGSRSTSRHDDRITPLGSFLRRTSLDELPQLINVLFGHMSIVGPRPHALASTAQDKLFWDIDPRYWERHRIKPGITGLAQVRGYRGSTETHSDLLNRVQADLEYLVGWNLWRDVAIMLRTLRVLVHRNAF